MEALEAMAMVGCSCDNPTDQLELTWLILLWYTEQEDAKIRAWEFIEAYASHTSIRRRFFLRSADLVDLEESPWRHVLAHGSDMAMTTLTGYPRV